MFIKINQILSKIIIAKEYSDYIINVSYQYDMVIFLDKDLISSCVKMFLQKCNLRLTKCNGLQALRDIFAKNSFKVRKIKACYIISNRKYKKLVILFEKYNLDISNIIALPE